MKKLFEQQVSHQSQAGAKVDENFFITDMSIFMSYWYTALYVVIEGYKELGFADTRIDQILQSPNVETLKRYRNAMCHFQKNYYYHEKFMDFISSKGTADWIHEAHNAFSDWFLEQMKTSPNG